MRSPLLISLLCLVLGLSSMSGVGDLAHAQVTASEPNSDARGFLTTLGELMWEGGIFMVPIALASILMLGVTLERSWALRRNRICPPGLPVQVTEALTRGDLADARRLVEDDATPIARVLHSGLLHWEDDLADVSHALEDTGLREADDMQKHLPALQGVASVSPLLGLLGTVVGMIKSFLQVAKESAIGNPELLAEGIGQALVTTAAGLCVAIPALILYYVFRGRIRKLVRQLDDAARSVIAIHRKEAARGHSPA